VVFDTAGLPGRTTPRQTILAGPRPAAVAAFWITLADSAILDRSALDAVTHPSPIRPARSIAASDMPPSRIGGPGRCTGGGSCRPGGMS
jgi:hypothetical protein